MGADGRLGNPSKGARGISRRDQASALSTMRPCERSGGPRGLFSGDTSVVYAGLAGNLSAVAIMNAGCAQSRVSSLVSVHKRVYFTAFTGTYPRPEAIVGAWAGERALVVGKMSSRRARPYMPRDRRQPVPRIPNSGPASGRLEACKEDEVVSHD